MARSNDLAQRSIDRIVATEHDSVVERTRMLRALQEETELWRAFLKATDGSDYCGIRYGVRSQEPQGESCPTPREPDAEAEDALVGRIVTADQLQDAIGIELPELSPATQDSEGDEA